VYVSKRNIPKLEEYTSYIKTIFHQDDSIAENSENEPLPATITESEEIALPTFEEKAPIFEETAPIIEETAPIIEETAPIIEETAPIIEETAPIIEDTAPIIEDTAPIIDEKAPIFEETAPILNNEEVVSTASNLGEDNTVDEMPSEQKI